MEKPWAASIEYSLEDVRKILSDVGFGPVRGLRELGEGWDNKVFLINDEWVFRFVRREKGLPFSAQERIALPLLPKDLSLEVPRVEYRGLHLNKWPWVGYRLLRGQTPLEREVRPDERVGSATQLARFLKQLHSDDVEKYRHAGLCDDWCGHMSLAKRLPQTRERIQKMHMSGDFTPREGHFALLDEIEIFSPRPREALCHGDLKSAHLLFENGRIVSVMDWGDTHIGHPACDAALAFSFFPPEGRKVFQAEYGGDEELWFLAKFRAFFHSLIILEYAIDIRDEALIRESRQALEWTFA